MHPPASTIDRLTTRVGQLYSLPAVAVQVMELTNNPRVDTRALKKCIENDPALTGKILRVVNSSLFGLRREISDLNQALALLGSKPLKLLVLGFSLPTGLFSDVGAEALAYYWRHTLIRAVAGREIAQTLYRVPGDDAFIAGLLQDVGLLLLIQEFGEPYIRFFEKVRAAGEDLIAMERESMGFDHTMLSARMLDQWGLPEVLVEAVAWQSTSHGTGVSPVAELPQVLHLARLVARLLAEQQADALGDVLRTGRQYVDLTGDQLETLVDSLQVKVGSLADVLSLRLPEGTDYRDVLVQAHQQLAVVAGEAAEALLCSSGGGPRRSNKESLLAEIHGLAAVVAEMSQRATAPVGPGLSPTDQPQGAAAPPAPTPARPREVKPVGQVSSATIEADPSLLGRLEAAMAACRQSRRPLSLLLVEINHAEQLVVAGCLDALAALRELLRRLCGSADHPGATFIACAEAAVAVILPNCERGEAVEAGNRLVADFRRQSPGGNGSSCQAVALSVGVASVVLPPKNFRPGDLFAAAERCLYGSHAAGGSVVKSIEIY